MLPEILYVTKLSSLHLLESLAKQESSCCPRQITTLRNTTIELKSAINEKMRDICLLNIKLQIYNKTYSCDSFMTESCWEIRIVYVQQPIFTTSASTYPVLVNNICCITLSPWWIMNCWEWPVVEVSSTNSVLLIGNKCKKRKKWKANEDGKKTSYTYDDSENRQ